MSKKGRVRFSIFDDIILLREVLRQNPYECDSRWNDVLDNIVKITSKNFTLRSIKEHLQHLLDLWTNEDRANLRKSGTEEQYNEKEQLLHQIKDMKREFRHYLSNKMSIKESECRRKGIETRMQTSIISGHSENTFDDCKIICEENLKIEQENEDSQNNDIHDSNAEEERTSPISVQNISCPIRIRKLRSAPLRNSSLHFLQEKQRAEIIIREKELKFQERRLALEEKKLEIEEKKIKLEEEKFSLEREERRQKLIMEIEDRKHRNVIEERQQNLIDILLQKIGSNK